MTVDDEEEDRGGGGRAREPRNASRSRSRGRVPSEILARKQQLVASSAADSSLLGVVSNNEPHSPSSSSGAFSSSLSSPRESSGDRGRSRARNTTHMSGIAMEPSGAPDAANEELDAKLESLSQQLLSHQNAEQYQQSFNTSSHMRSSSNQQQSSGALSMSGQKSIDDVYILLAKKEKDLQLAAELGKVLLEKNEALSKANERITEDYSHKLEVSYGCFEHTCLSLSLNWFCRVLQHFASEPTIRCDRV